MGRGRRGGWGRGKRWGWGGKVGREQRGGGEEGARGRGILQMDMMECLAGHRL